MLSDLRQEHFSNTKRNVCQCVFEHTGHTVSIHRGKKLGYALPMKTKYKETQKLKMYDVKDSTNHADKDKIFKRIIEFKFIKKLFSITSETMTACRAARTFQNAPCHTN